MSKTPFKMKGWSPFTQKEKPIVAEAVSTSVVKPRTVEVKEHSKEIPSGWFSGTGFKATRTKLLKKKTNVLRSFTDFLKSKKK